ncbi:MAG TPA: BREX-1 system adenine-specific DNA-methyltransferase PglX, partial [Candidatus Saccharicenans sp.]|nr:BREX-1 system adenine-specific DNA-methyltransferase PglX [Candidatus Saccharicenans sp.]
MFQGSNWETKEGPGKAGKTSCRAGIGQGYTQSKKDRTMNWDIITRIQRFTLMARHNLEREAAEQLEGIYGWLPDGSFTGEDLYSPALIQVEEAKKTRTSLENYAAAELEAGSDYKLAREDLIRETAFTWLNRFVALRMMEERQLIKETISRLSDSNAFKLWVADECDPEAEDLYLAGDIPIGPLGEGPRQKAYRRFLLWECERLAREASVLFDITNLPSRLFPRPLVLKEIVNDMNSPDLLEAWKQDNEETIGWVYQSFNAEELQAAFAKTRQQGKKFSPRDIPAVTQLFTIRWVVRFLVENSLGRLWIEMHPDSKLIKSLSYFVPTKEHNERRMKPVKDITFLDPACGSMHFGLIAFDLFEQMYSEEIENKGKPGWPEMPSVEYQADIPAAIINNNLFGIDLDLRAVQLSAMTLFLRAKTVNPACQFTDRNIACANVEHITAGRLESFINSAEFEHPIYERILKAMAEKLRDSDNLGSLLRPEEELKRLIEEERKKAQVEAEQKELRFPELFSEKFETQAGVEEFFGLLEEKVLEKLDEFVRQSRQIGQDPAHFAAEAAKGLRLLRLVQHRYDVVTTNPPYLSARKMNGRLAELLEDEYPDGKSDLYAAFIQRCSELLSPEGLLGMLTMHSFMFISTYEKLRERLQNEMAVVTMAHFAGGLFAVGNPGTLQTVAFVLRREEDEGKRKNSIGTYFRLVHERDADLKCETFESAAKVLRADQPHPKVFFCKQQDFDAIPGKPWVYWLPEKLRNLFKQFSKLGEIAEPKQGLATADNNRFLRMWWEVGLVSIGSGMKDRNEAKNSGLKWFPYMKGGTPFRWYGNQEYTVNWHNDGAEIKEWIIFKYPYLKGKWEWVVKNVDYYFRRGVTWSKVSSSGFAARIIPTGFIFSDAGMACFPSENLLELILALLNTRVAEFILSALNPTINYQVGDIERLPVPAERNEKIAELVNKCIELKKKDSRESEITYDFVHPLEKLEEQEARNKELAELESQIDDEISRLYGLSRTDLEFIDRELSNENRSQENNSNDNGASSDAEESQVEALDESGWALNWISYAAGIV